MATNRELSGEDYTAFLYQKASAYLLRRHQLGFGNTGRPADGLYHKEGLVVISDSFTGFSPYEELRAETVNARHRALRLGAAAIDIQAEGIGEALLMRPADFMPLPGQELPMVFGVFVAQGLDMERQDIVLIDPIQGVADDPASLPIAQALYDLPPPSHEYLN